MERIKQEQIDEMGKLNNAIAANIELSRLDTTAVMSVLTLLAERLKRIIEAETTQQPVEAPEVPDEQSIKQQKDGSVVVPVDDKPKKESKVK